MAHHRPLARVVRALFWVALITAFVMATLPKPPELPFDPTDKTQHMLAFAVLTLLLRLGYPLVPIHKVVVMMAAFGAFIEVVQLIPDLHRTADFQDWLADMGAVVAMLLVIEPCRRLLTALRKRGPEAAE